MGKIESICKLFERKEGDKIIINNNYSPTEEQLEKMLKKMKRRKNE